MMLTELYTTTEPLKIHSYLNLLSNIEKFFDTLAKDLLGWYIW